MSWWLQHLLVLTLVAACLVFVARQAFSALRGRKSKLGSCCSRGCQSTTAEKPKTEKIVFLPAEMLGKRR